MAALVLALAAAAPAQDRGAAAGTGVVNRRIIQSRLAVEDAQPGHELVQTLGVDRISTTDRIRGVSFEGAEFRTYEQADLVSGSGMVRGYGTWEARTGEKLFLVYGYLVPPQDVGGNTFAGTFEWQGGTGALATVRGKGTMEGDLAGPGRVRYRWAGSYEQEMPIVAVPPPR